MILKLTKAQRTKVLSTDDIFKVMQQILLRKSKTDRDKEHFWTIGLDRDNTILYIELVCIGNYNSIFVEPINVFRVAMLKGADRLVLSHNHPSGQVSPSDEDRKLTDRLIQIGKILRVQVVDHLIITPTSFLSFADNGLYEKLDESLAFKPRFMVEEQIRREEHKLRKEAVTIAKEKGFKKGKKEGLKEGIDKGKKEGTSQGRKEEKLRMVKDLKQQLVKSTIISNASGIPIEEIEALHVEPIPVLSKEPWATS